MGLLIKSGDELYDAGVDLVSRKNFSEAREKFQSAIQKGTKNDRMAAVYVRLIELYNARGDASRYQALREALKQVPGNTFKFGVTTVDVSALDAEADLDIQEIQATGMPDEDFMAKGQALIDVAGGFASVIGDNPLAFEEMFKGTTGTTGTKESLILQAQAYEIMGKGTAYSDPKQASEYLQMAYNFRRQIGDSGEDDLRMMNNLAISAKCWFCGRPVAGKGVHFMGISSNITQMFRDVEEKEGVKSSSGDFSDVYVCLPCYTAISNRSDQISRAYYERCMQEMRAMEARLERKIAAASVASIRLSR